MKRKNRNKYTVITQKYLRNRVNYIETSYNLLHLSVIARSLDGLLYQESYLEMPTIDYIKRYCELVSDLKETYTLLYNALDKPGFIDEENSAEDLPF